MLFKIKSSEYKPYVCIELQKRKEKTSSNAKKRNGILLPKLWEKILKFEAEGQEFANFYKSLEQFIQTVNGPNNFW